MHRRNVPTQRPPRVTHSEDMSTDTQLSYVRRTPRYRWPDYAFWSVVGGTLTGAGLYVVYALVGWVRGLR